MLTFLPQPKSCALIQIISAGRSLRFPNPSIPENMEPTTGIEPVNLILTKDALYQLSYVGPLSLERETGLEPATLSLEG